MGDLATFVHAIEIYGDRFLSLQNDEHCPAGVLTKRVECLSGYDHLLKNEKGQCNKMHLGITLTRKTPVGGVRCTIVLCLMISWGNCCDQ